MLPTVILNILELNLTLLLLDSIALSSLMSNIGIREWVKEVGSQRFSEGGKKDILIP